MGLDMYLYRKSYVKNWDFMKPEEKHTITVKKGGKARKDIDSSKISEITEQVAYWRKANAIHGWFVKNVQDGRDECQESWVSHDKLKELVSLCKKVLKVAKLEEGQVSNGRTLKNGEWVTTYIPGKVITNPEEVAAILPSQAGFFFGSTDYDEYFLDDIKKTIEMLSPYVDDDKGEFYHHSSW